MSRAGSGARAPTGTQRGVLFLERSGLSKVKPGRKSQRGGHSNSLMQGACMASPADRNPSRFSKLAGGAGRGAARLTQQPRAVGLGLAVRALRLGERRPEPLLPSHMRFVRFVRFLRVLIMFVHSRQSRAARSRQRPQTGASAGRQAGGRGHAPQRVPRSFPCPRAASPPGPAAPSASRFALVENKHGPQHALHKSFIYRRDAQRPAPARGAGTQAGPAAL